MIIFVHHLFGFLLSKSSIVLKNFMSKIFIYKFKKLTPDSIYSTCPCCNNAALARLGEPDVALQPQECEQGCQMAYFQTKNPNLGKFGSVFQ
jgi:hypothetical protein